MKLRKHRQIFLLNNDVPVILSLLKCSSALQNVKMPPFNILFFPQLRLYDIQLLMQHIFTSLSFSFLKICKIQCIKVTLIFAVTMF